MTKEEKCENCKYYRVGRGKYGTGICISDKSKKHYKDFVLKNDSCKSWERNTNE